MSNYNEAKAKAEKIIDDLCHSRIDWTMRVPADPERDPDLILSAFIQAADTALVEKDEELTRLMEENLALLGVIDESGDAKLAIKALEATS